MARPARIKRSARKRELEKAAAAVVLPESCDVCVVGGGAAGLVAAIAAAEADARVVVVERELECGRTILATGGGRCNFANRQLSPERYNNPEFVHAVCGESWLDDILEFFAASGLAWTEEEERLYPTSMQAASVREVLLARAQRAGVILACGRTAQALELLACEDSSPKEARWELQLDSELLGKATIRSHCVILASGGKACPSGHDLASSEALPVLCPLAADGLPFSQLDGRRARVAASLMRNGHCVASERGELLFRDYGVSGIVVFDLSRFAQAGDTLVLDLVPDVSAEQLEKLCQAAGSAAGIVDPIIAEVLWGNARQNSFGEERLSFDAQTLASQMKALSCTVRSRYETEHAQVMRGGLVTASFDPESLMARSRPGLFACGEALDIDGACGGFNLAWAWKSGLVAGNNAAQMCLSKAMV
ncbi:MAG: aminoacetone oxidase family FAD-binding enzyme [Atopobiaceae bacterium]|nr:aminoacetone oxidase family FAD-binding enzyme [Atopobiaceae bacterium]